MVLQTIETKLAELCKKAPQMGESGRKSLAGALWWLAALFGVLQLWMAWRLWDVAHYASELDKAVDALNSYYGYNVVDTDLGLFYYASFAVLLASAALYLFAIPGLKAFQKSKGWNLVFYALIIEVVYGVLIAFSDVYGGFGSFVWSILMTAVVAYLVFQVRDNFKDSKTTSSTTTTTSKK